MKLDLGHSSIIKLTFKPFGIHRARQKSNILLFFPHRCCFCSVGVTPEPHMHALLLKAVRNGERKHYLVGGAWRLKQILEGTQCFLKNRIFPWI